MSKVKTKYKRGQFRIRPENEHDVSVDINGKDFIEVTKAYDISESGIGVILPEGLKNNHTNENVSIIISLPNPENKIFQVKAVISHQTKDRFGIYFTELQPEVKKSIRQFILFLLKKEPFNIRIGYKIRLFFRKLFGQKYLLPLFLILALFLVPLYIDEIQNNEIMLKIKKTLQISIDTGKEKEVIQQDLQTEKKVTDQTKSLKTPNEALKKSINIIGMEQFYLGTVNIIDINDSVISEILTVATKNGWVAIPTELCISAINLSFTNRYSESIHIRDGIFESGDTAGLWKLQSNTAFDSPEINRWDQESPTRWRSLESSESIDLDSLEIFKTYSQFTTCQLPENIRNSGIFIQNGRIVGWSFKGVPDHCFMLNTDTLKPNTDLDRFYRTMFAGKREEFFVKANMIDDPSRLTEKLLLYVQGFEASPALEAENTPDELYPETVLLEMSTVISMLYDNSDFIDITETLNNRNIIERLSSLTIINVINAYDKLYGAERAIDITRNYLNLIESDKDLLLPVYTRWIENYIYLDNIYEAINSCDYSMHLFPDNPELNLLRTDLFIREAKWSEARNQLRSLDYPESLKERAARHERLIKENIETPEQIVIDFKPGSQEIVTNAYVNGNSSLEFLIDTGASFVSVPYSYIDDLGIEIDDETQVKTVITAGGPESAYEVTLSSLEIDGVSVHDITAYVLDMEDQTMGLLGMNFIKHFNMEIDNETGKLYLTPKDQ